MARYDDTFVDRFLEPWNRHDVDGALALMTDDCVWEVTRGREPHGTLYTGQTAVRSAIVEAFKALPRRQLPTRSEFFRRGPSSGGRRDFVSRLFD
jgi:ketosteroid isomerase-like protein